MKKLKLFFDKIEKDKKGCWIWIGSKCKDGYGHFRDFKSHMTGAHRFSYEFFVGKIPKNLQIDHLCKVPSCVNPDHLETVTPRENLNRAAHWSKLNREKTKCPLGHPYEGKNVRFYKGSRYCRICNRNRMRKLRKFLKDQKQ